MPTLQDRPAGVDHYLLPHGVSTLSSHAALPPTREDVSFPKAKLFQRMHPTLPLQGTGVPKTEASACQGFQPALFLYLLIVPCLVHPSPSPWVSKNAHSSFPTSVLQRAPSRNLRTHSTVFLPPSLPSYASYLVWKDLGGGFKWRLALPLGLYAFQLPISWVVLMLFLEAANPGLVRLRELSTGGNVGGGEPTSLEADS